MSKTRENIIFRKEWRDALKGFSAEIRSEVYEAILAYSFDGEVIEMSDVARMAFTFIKTHIDNINSAYEATCEKRRQSAQQRWHASECKPMQKDANDANAYFASKNDASECKPMHNDNDNDIDINNNISLSKSLSSSGEKEFDTEKIGGLTAAERERILEIFYFERNLKFAKEESEKFFNYYEANGWCRANSSEPVKNKIPLAKSWKVEREDKYYPESLRTWLHDIFRIFKKNKIIRKPCFYNVFKFIFHSVNIFLITFKTSCVSSGSRADVGSSKQSIFGDIIRALAIATLCC